MLPGFTSKLRASFALRTTSTRRRFILAMYSVLTMRTLWVGAAAWIVSQIVVLPMVDGQIVMDPRMGGGAPSRHPPPAYIAGMRMYHEGNIPGALELFDAAMSQGRVDPNGRSIDSIPAMVMIGECQYLMGDCAGSLDTNNRIARIFTRPDTASWLRRADWNTLAISGARSRPQWLWADAAAINVLPLADQVSYRRGDAITPQSIRGGGTLESPTIRRLDMGEILRTTAIAMLRRRVLLGPLGTDDPLIQNALDQSRFPADLNSLPAREMIGSMRGCMYYAAGNDERTRGAAQFLGGVGVHPVTAVAKFAILRSGSGGDDVNNLVPGLLGTVNTAAALEQFEWIGPPLELAAGYCNRQSAPVVAAAASNVAAAIGTRSRLAATHAAIAAADAYVTAGDPATASKQLQTASAFAGRRDVVCPRLEAYLAYVTLRVEAATGRGGSILDVRPGANSSGSAAQQNALRKLASFATLRGRRGLFVSSPRVLQMRQLPGLLAAGGGASTANDLISAYLGDPPIDVWRCDPVDAMQAVVSDRGELHRTRLLYAIEADNPKLALSAINDYLADRFYASLGAAARAVDLRSIGWTAVDDRPPAVTAAIKRDAAVGDLVAKLAAEHALPASAVELDQRSNLMVYSRHHIPHHIYPNLDAKQPLKSLGESASGDGNDAMIAVTVLDNRLCVVTFDGRDLQLAVVPAAPIAALVSQMIDAIGATRNAKVLFADGQTTQQRAANVQRLGRRLCEQLVPDATWWDRVDGRRLWIVPDGTLWYLPFELLTLPDEGNANVANEADDAMVGGTTVGERFEVRYVTTPSAALRPVGLSATNGNVAVVAGGLFSPSDDAADQDAIANLLDRQPDATLAGTPPLDVPIHRMGGSASHLVVASTRPVPRTSTWVLRIDPTGGTPDDTLSTWIRFPHDVPTTAAWFGTRSAVGSGSGEDLFQFLAAMRASGVRTTLMSRWAVGGESTLLAAGEYVQEVPVVGVQDAWDRSLAVLRQSPLDPGGEPLLSRMDAAREDIDGSLPLFWSGYLVAGAGD